MNLESLTNKLNNVLNFIERNNIEHYDLNENLLRKEVLKEGISGTT